MHTAPETGRSAPRFVQIGPHQDGQRLDNFLLSQLKGVPRSFVYRVLRKGEVRVNKARAKPDYRLKEGDTVRIPPVRLPEENVPAQPGDRVLALIDSSILHEDEGLIILNKPSGVAVHGGSGVSYGVIEAMRALRPRQDFLELVHRLDRETSGCLMIAKKGGVLRALHTLLRGEGVEKRYMALIEGDWRGGARTVSASLKKNILQSGERVVRVDAEGKESRSIFRPLRTFRGATLVEVAPLTGRTHQIRVHAAHIGQPIAGDAKYGDAGFNRLLRDRGLKRLFLHAHSLRVALPGMDAPLTVTAPLDPELQRVLDVLADSGI